MRGDVDKVFPAIAKELGYNKKELNWDWLKALSGFLSSTGILFKLMFYGVLLALIVFVIYKVIVSFTKSSKKVFVPRTPEESCETVVNTLAKVLEFKSRENYTMATLYLHYGTINFLRESNIMTMDRDYTNRDIFALLKDSPLYNTFYLIAISAQGVLFNNEIITREGFLQIEKAYIRDFK